MSNSDKKFPLHEAKAIAENVLQLLHPYCERIQIAGSIRRKKNFVDDIEIVAMPKLIVQGSLFESGNVQSEPVKGFQETVNQWERVKGHSDGKYTQRNLPEDIKLDLFIANSKNWGFIYAMRTGSAEFSKRKLAYRWTELGYTAKDGLLHKDGKIYTFPEEEDLFKLLKLQWVEPEFRI